MLQHLDQSANDALHRFTHSLAQEQQEIEVKERGLQRASEHLRTIQQENTLLRAQLSHNSVRERLDAMEREKCKLAAGIQRVEEVLSKQREELLRARAPRMELEAQSKALQEDWLRSRRLYVLRASRVQAAVSQLLLASESVEVLTSQWQQQQAVLGKQQERVAQLKEEVQKAKETLSDTESSMASSCSSTPSTVLPRTSEANRTKRVEKEEEEKRSTAREEGSSPASSLAAPLYSINSRLFASHGNGKHGEDQPPPPPPLSLPDGERTGRRSSGAFSWLPSFPPFLLFNWASLWWSKGSSRCTGHQKLLLHSTSTNSMTSGGMACSSSSSLFPSSIPKDGERPSSTTTPLSPATAFYRTQAQEWETILKTLQQLQEEETTKVRTLSQEVEGAGMRVRAAREELEHTLNQLACSTSSRRQRKRGRSGQRLGNEMRSESASCPRDRSTTLLPASPSWNPRSILPPGASDGSPGETDIPGETSENECRKAGPQKKMTRRNGSEGNKEDEVHANEEEEVEEEVVRTSEEGEGYDDRPNEMSTTMLRPRGRSPSRSAGFSSPSLHSATNCLRCARCQKDILGEFASVCFTPERR